MIGVVQQSSAEAGRDDLGFPLLLFYRSNA
jgi:hypothetical protein